MAEEEEKQRNEADEAEKAKAEEIVEEDTKRNQLQIDQETLEANRQKKQLEVERKKLAADQYRKAEAEKQTTETAEIEPPVHNAKADMQLSDASAELLQMTEDSKGIIKTLLKTGQTVDLIA